MASLQDFCEIYLIPAQLSLVMFGMGATLSLRELSKVFTSPKPLFIGMLLQLLGVPLLALGVKKILNLDQGFAVGLLLVAIVPGGAMSNLMTLLARGHVPLSIALTSLSTLFAVATIPLLLRWIVRDALPSDFVFPRWLILRDLLFYLLGPLTLGMVIYRMSTLASFLSRYAVRLSILIVLFVAVVSATSGRVDLIAYGITPVLAVFILGGAIAFLISFLLFLFHISKPERVATAIELVARNTGISLMLTQYFFTGEEKQAHVLYMSLLYAGCVLFFVLPLVIYGRTTLERDVCHK